MKKILILGLASNRQYHLPPIANEDWEIALFHYLKRHDLPLASACNAQGVCLKCRVGSENDQAIISCQVTLRELWLREQMPLDGDEDATLVITVDYL